MPLNHRESDHYAEEWRGNRVDYQLEIRALRLARPLIISLDVGQDQALNTRGMMFHHQLSGRAPMIMSDNSGALDAQPVHQSHNHFHLIGKPIIVVESHHRVAETEQIRRDDSITPCQKWNDVAPFE